MNWLSLGIAGFFFVSTFFEWRAGYVASQGHFPERFHWYASLGLRYLWGALFLAKAFPQISQQEPLNSNLFGLTFFISVAIVLLVLILEGRRLWLKQRNSQSKK